MTAVLWTIAGTLAATVVALIALGWRHIRTVRSEAMLAARCEEQDKELERAIKTNASQAVHNAALRGGLEQSLGDLDTRATSGLLGWANRIEASLGDNRNGQVLAKSTGASEGIITGAGDDHDTEPNARGVDAHFSDSETGGSTGSDDGDHGDEQLDGPSRGNLRGEK